MGWTARKRAWLIAVIATVALFIFTFAPLGYDIAVLLFPIDITEYAPGYSDAAFGKVEVGQTAYEVVALLGEPMFKSPEWDEVWYSYCATVEFDAKGLVMGFTPGPHRSGSERLRIGMTKEEVAAICGEPDRPYYGWGKHQQRWVYSFPHDFDPWDDVTWKARCVVIDTTTGQVSKVMNTDYVHGQAQ